MDNIEGVKKILNKYIDYETWLSDKSPIEEDAAQQICQLLKLPEGEPPLLSISQKTQLLFDGGKFRNPNIIADEVAKAQRDSDINWIRGL